MRKTVSLCYLIHKDRCFTVSVLYNKCHYDQNLVYRGLDSRRIILSLNNELTKQVSHKLPVRRDFTESLDPRRQRTKVEGDLGVLEIEVRSHTSFYLTPPKISSKTPNLTFHVCSEEGHKVTGLESTYRGDLCFLGPFASNSDLS